MQPLTDRRGRSGRKTAVIVAGAGVVAFGIALASYGFLNDDDGTTPVPERTTSAGAQAVPAGALVVGKGGRYSTVQAAVNDAQPGNTVLISGGTYREAIHVPRSGRAGSYITIKAKSGEKVTIDGGGTRPEGTSDTQGLITLDKREYVRISGLTITGSNGHGIYAGHTSHLVLDNNDIADSQDGGILVGDGTDITVDNNSVHGNNAAAAGGDISLAANEAITMFRITDFDIKNNKVYENDEEGIDVKAGTSDGSVHDNDVYRNNGPNIYVDGADDVKVYNNRVSNARGSTKAGIGLAVESGGSAKGVQIYNNVIYGNPGGGVDFWIGHYSDVQIYNNTFYNNGRAALRADHGTVSDSVALNNIAYRDPMDAVPGFSFQNNLTTSDNAGFVNLDKGDVRLKKGSPAVDAGSAAKAPTTDIAGTTRPFGDAPDIGAYEYDPSKD